ncbi:hypothetical protein B7463_g4737, partial [Scytalidium lignicola]
MFNVLETRSASASDAQDELSGETHGLVTRFLLQPSPESLEFPTVYFLDYQAFKRSGQPISKVTFKVVPYVTASIGDPQTVAVEYFRKVHWWMPIISNKRLFDSMLNPLTEPDSELPLLLLAMKVILWNPSKQQSKDPKIETYLIAKRMIDEAVTAGLLSLQLLQAQVLLAVFGLGHAIYPAAYLSVGACARYGIALGVDISLRPDFQAQHPSINVLQIEERRRTWWAILILDRFLQLGNPRRPLSTEDPKPESLLPSDDEAFDQGNISGPSFPVSAAANVKMGALARMSQASYLLSHVYRYNHFRSETKSISDQQQEYWQLDNTIRSLLNLSYVEGELRRMAVCGQTSICYSALIALHDPDSFRTDPQHLQFAVDLLKPLADAMSWDSAIFLSGTLVSVNDASPLLLFWAYEAGTIYNRLMPHYERDTLELLYQMKEKLRIMSHRWQAGNAYLEILNSNETRMHWSS